MLNPVPNPAERAEPPNPANCASQPPLRQNSNLERFQLMSIPRAVAGNALPAMLSMLVVFVYNVADTFFIGQTGDELQVAAVSLTIPVFLIFMAVGTFIGVGGASEISRAFGAGDSDHARRISAFCFYATILTGLLFMGLFWLLMPRILILLGVSPQTSDFTRQYLNYFTIGAGFVIFSQAYTSIIRAEGHPNQAMFGMILGTVLNIILDPLLILYLEMGVAGAALATVIANLATTVYFLHFLVRGGSNLSIRPRDFTLSCKILAGVSSIGLPASLNPVLMTISFVILNNLLAAYGDIHVAAMGIAVRVSLIVVLIQIGFGQGIQPLIGYNYGAANFERLRAVMRFSYLWSVIIGTTLSVIYYFGAGLIVGAFIDHRQVTESGTYMLKVMTLTRPFLGIMFVSINALQAMGKALPSLALSLTRQGIMFIPLMFILNPLLGLTGLIYAQPLADVVAIITAAAFYYAVSRNFKTDSSAAAGLSTSASATACIR